VADKHHEEPGGESGRTAYHYRGEVHILLGLVQAEHTGNRAGDLESLTGETRKWGER
jgi:hypothetical protein